MLLSDSFLQFQLRLSSGQSIYKLMSVGFKYADCFADTHHSKFIEN